MKLLIFVVVTINVAIQSLYAMPVIEDKEWFHRKLGEAYNASKEAYHPNPHEVVNDFNRHVRRSMLEHNVTRRELSAYKGPCKAVNPIDKCWRCKEDWADDRKKLAECAKGFGQKTTGGKDGEYYVVTDNSDDDVVDPKPGTLRYGVLRPEPLWIIFKESMKIKLKTELMVTSNKTIDGRGVCVQITGGAGITIQYARNVIIHNIKIYKIVPGSGGNIRSSHEHVGIRGVDDGDAISVFASSNIWLDHLSMWDCRDGLVDVVKGSTAVTISNCHLTKHDYVFLFGASDTDPNDKVMQITVAFNHFGKKLIQRMPRCRFGFFHVVNNDYTHWEMYAIGGTSAPTIISQGNRYIAPDDQRLKQITNRNRIIGNEWLSWQWRSEKDLLKNDAVFIETGPPFKKTSDRDDYVDAQPGEDVGDMTLNAGYLKCIKGKKC